MYRVPHGGHGAVARRMNQALGPWNSNTKHLYVYNRAKPSRTINQLKKEKYSTFMHHDCLNSYFVQLPLCQRGVVTMAEPPKSFATRRRGEAYGVGTWRKGGEWRECQTPVFVKIY